MTDAELNVEPAELISAAGDLDRLADRLDGALRRLRPALVTPAAGRDEVSVVAAKTLQQSAERFGVESGTGVYELRKIAAVLRSQATGFTRADDDAAGGFRL